MNSGEANAATIFQLSSCWTRFMRKPRPLLTAATGLAALLSGCGNVTTGGNDAQHTSNQNRRGAATRSIDPETLDATLGSRAGRAPERLDATDPDLVVGTRGSGLRSWRMERANQCLMVREHPNSDSERQMARLRDDIDRSALGRNLLRSLEGGTTTICPDTAMPFWTCNTLAVYYGGYDAVVVRANFPRGRQILHGAHELRHAWQQKVSGFDMNGNMNLADYAAVTMMNEADARAFAVAVAWQLKEQGDPEAWDAAKSLSIYQLHTDAFERHINSVREQRGEAAARSDTTLGEAMRLSFREWFANPNIRGSYVDGVRDGVRSRPDRTWPGTAAMPAGNELRLGHVPGHSRIGAQGSYLTRTERELAQSIAREHFPTNTVDPHPPGHVEEPKPATPPVCAA